MMQVRINLNTPPTADKINVDLQWNLLVTSSKPGCLATFFRKHNRVARDLKINISNINVPKDVVCDKAKLFSILVDEELYSQSEFPIAVHMGSMKTPFQLLFHQAEIKDCLKPQDANPRSYKIKFTVEVLDNKNEIINSVDDFIEVIFESLGVKSQYEIDVEDENIQYDASLSRERVGDFVAWLNEPFKFTPKQKSTILLKLYKGTQELPGLISFEDGSNKTSIEIKANRNNLVKKPIYIDFTTIPNPFDNEEDFTIEALIESSAYYSPEIKETILKQKHFKLLKDQQGSELRVETIHTENGNSINSDGNSTSSVLMNFVPRSRLKQDVLVILKNIATDNSNAKSGIYIKNLTLSESLLDDVRVVGEDNTQLHSFITFDGIDVDSMISGKGLFIPNGQDAKTIIKVSFNPANIVDVHNSNNYDFKIESTLTFDYWEDKDGLGVLNDDNRKIKSVSIMWQLHLEPNPEWLCVDYGSSAIVCRYDDQIIDLKMQKDKIFRNADDGKYRADDVERYDQFLSSDIVLHNVRDAVHSTLCSEQSRDVATPYLNLSVCLSPTSSLIKADVKTQLPCLKILVGNEYLPDKADYLTFQYARRGADGNISATQAREAKQRNEDTCLLKITSIFNEAYSALFKYFVFPGNQDKTVNKLVLTYPNTYTPVHLKTLEKIARATFPKVRDGYMKFVCESDAVAAYYIQNWDKFEINNNRTRRVRELRNSETVLVYDMGAGTLDITLFTKSLNKNGRINVDILGKIGSGKAGNYLDYLISEIIKDRVKGAVTNDNIVSTTLVSDTATLHKRLDIKYAVKDIIKPNLLPDSTLEYNGISFRGDVILDDERFGNFLNQITQGIIYQLMNYIRQTNLNIDTVIMSGRSCRLESLQNAMTDAMHNLGSNNARIMKFETTDNTSKTVVVDGAMAKASLFSSPDSQVLIRSRRLYASYGLVYKVLGGNYKYVELLNSSDLPLNSENVNLDDYEGENVTVTETAAADTIRLIQTYLSPEDTEDAYNHGDMEFISEMEEYNMAEFNGRNQLNVKLRLDYRNNISLYVDGRNSIGCPPKGVDLSSEITKRSIWPVTI